MQQRNFFLTLLMATVMMVFSPQIMRAAVETVTVGERTSSSYQVPYGNYFKNSTSQMLYTADEIGKKGIIQSIAFYVSNAYEFNCSELKIYMGETDLTQLSDAFTSNGLQLVYSGTDVTIGSASGWETMTLSTPFDYSGEKNLVVVVCRKSSSWTSGLKYGVSDGKSLYRLSDDYSSYADIDDERPIYSDTDVRAAAQFQIKTSDHVMEHHEAVAPTATTAGNYEYWYCTTHCQKYFKDEYGTEEYGDSEWIIPAGACPHQLIEHAAAHNTCGDDGNTLYYECSICHHYFSDAAAENEVEENSWVIPADPSQHEFTGNYNNKGFGQCDVCNKTLYNIYKPAEYDDEENCFYIYNVGQLYWFADKVNNGTSSDEDYPFNARVRDDLVVNSNVLTDEGELNGDGSNFLAWTPIDNYQGVFNGASYTIKGLYGGVGLFNNNKGTVTRIYIEDSYFEGDITVGGIVAYNAGTVENCYSNAIVKGNGNVGGLVGFNADNGVVKNCYSRATVKAETTDAERYGNVVGYNGGTLANCYYLSDVADQQETAHPTVISKTAEQFASGEVAWLLNGEKVDETSVWGQFLGNDYAPAEAFPSPSMWNFVWKGYMCFDDSLQYANHYLHTEPNHDHVYDNGICKACGAYQTPESQTIDGVLTFDIANYGNALYVAKYTNEGNTCAARLVAPKVMMTGSYAYMTISNGTLTLDLNGDTLTTTNAQVILVDGGNVTIHDSSANGTGAVINGGSHGVNATSGSLTITSGTFIGGGGFAVQTSSSCTSLAISGGKYVSNYYYYNNNYVIYTPDKSALAPGYAYYNMRTDEELTDYTNQPIYVAQLGDTVIVKQASVKAVLTKNGEDTNYYSFNSAFAAAQQCTADDNATLKLMNNRTMPSSEGYITLSSGTFTLDLNGNTISNTNQTTILVSGANLTITDSSEGQTGMIKNSGAFAVDAQSGSLIITGGTFIGSGGYAVHTSSSCDSLAISGGKYYVTNETSRFYTPGKSALAPGYSYYNLRTGKELEDYTNQPIYVEQSTDTVIVKQASVKAVLTKNGENTNYYSFNSAFEAAQQCTADDNATLKLMKNYTIPDGYNAYITLSSGTFTLDLNGDTISNYNSQTILVSGANLTITDSSEGQTGTIKNLGTHGVNATSGSLIITGGTFIGGSGFAVLTSSSCDSLAISGGKYYATSGTSRLYTPGKSALAPGYSYYNLHTGKELDDYTNQPIYAELSTDTVIVKQGSVKAVLTRNGEGTNYSDFNAAFTAAQQCTADDNATLKLMQNYAIPDNKSYITLSSGTFTLDLNGDTISIYNAQTILVSGANLTITDSSEGQKGALINRASSAVNVTSGSLTVLAGNLIARNTSPALYVDSSTPTVLLKGGKYMSNSTYGSRIYTSGKSLLAPGYSYYNLSTDEEMNDVTSGYISMSNTADTLVVKLGAVKAMLTKGDVVTTYKDINAAFAAAQQCTASDNATLKLLQNYAIPNGKDAYITLSNGAFTLDLNGCTISNYDNQTILVSGAKLTITDSSEGQKGMIKNQGAFALNATNGSLIITGGTFVGSGGYAVQTSSSCDSLAFSGGKYYLTSGTYRLNTPGKSALAPGYSYYNLSTNEEMNDVTNGVLTVSNAADTVVVKLGSVKAMLTKGDEVTTYRDINAAFAAAQQCTADDNATLKLLKNVTLPTGDGYITLTDGAFTLDLNGDTLGIKGDWVLKLNGTDLTVTDSSEDKKGALVNTASIVVYAVSGSLTMQSGNLKGKGDYSIYNNEGGMDITLLSGSYSGGMQYHANSTLNLPYVAMFNAEGNEIALKYTEYVDFNCYRTEEPFTVNPYYTVGDVKGKLTKVDNKYFADKLTLVDGMPFNSEYDFTATEAEYSRTMTTKWGTICLPFDVTVSSVTDKTEEGYQPFDFYYVDDIDDDVMTLSKETQKVSAGIGMILRHDGTGGEVSIKETNVEVSSYAASASNATDLWGTFIGKTINSGYYIANDKFWNAANLDEGAVVPPYRAYVAGSGWAAAKGISIFDPEEETTGVTNVTADKADADAWYTLDGVKLGAKPNKAGIYIHGGKKVVVK